MRWRLLAQSGRCIRKRLESGSGRGRLAAHSRKPRHQCFGGVCEHRGVRRSRFHPGRESSRSVGDHCDVIPNPSAAASQNVALYCRLGGMSDLEVFGRRSLAIVSVATRRAGESPVRPIARIECCVSTQPPTILLRKTTFGVEEQPRENPGYAGDEGEQSRSCEAKTVDFSALCGPVTGFGTQGSQVRRTELLMVGPAAANSM
jgi:hypothetical protein